jgi:Fe-S oxidoreductase
MGAYDQRGREIATALAKVLRHLGISYGVLKKERCTGDAARRLGNDLLFQTLAEQNIDEIGRSGVKKLLSICPHCVRTLGEDYREFGAEITIEHHSELLARLLGRLPGKQGSERVVFHDPCYLGRYRGVYEEPRQVAALAGLAAEAPRSRERSFCCGAGGGLVFLGEEKGTRVSVERTRELVATGADVIAAACPFCNTMFADALATRGAAGPRLLDIAQIAAGVLH